MFIRQKDIDEIKSKCKQFNVKHLFLFGSTATKDYHDESDIDLLVDFENISNEDYFDNYYNFKDFLTEHFNREIDLLETRALNNPFLINEINKHKILLYGKAD